MKHLKSTGSWSRLTDVLFHPVHPGIFLGSCQLPAPRLAQVVLEALCQDWQALRFASPKLTEVPGMRNGSEEWKLHYMCILDISLMDI